MDFEADVYHGLSCARPRTFSNTSQQSQHSSKNFPLMTSDSGLYTCSSNTSNCSLQLESDTDSGAQRLKAAGLTDERLKLALQDVHKLRSELERLTKSEQWYKQELKQQKHSRLEDLERIYTQERKFMQENQRLQRECIRLYEKCNELEKELEKQNFEISEHHVFPLTDEDDPEKNIQLFEKEQQLALIKDQQQLISVLRKQKRSLLEDLRNLTEEKDEKVMELQRLVADLEFDNKLITKKCKQYAKERIHLENNLKQTDTKLTSALEEKMNLQKSLVDLREQLDIQQQLLKYKEAEIESIQRHYTHKIQQEQDLDQVHILSVKYQEEVNLKSLQIINLKERLHEMEIEMKDMENLQQQHELQQRQIDQLNFTIETYRLEVDALKAAQTEKNQQLDDILKQKDIMHKNLVEQQNDFLKVKNSLKTMQEQYKQVQELYKKTQFQLELLEIEQGKTTFQNENDKQDIVTLRCKLKEYLQQIKDLSKKIQDLTEELERAKKQNYELQQNKQELQQIIQALEEDKATKTKHKQKESVENKKEGFSDDYDEDFLQLQQECNKLQHKIDYFKNLHEETQTEANFNTESYTLKEISASQENENQCLNISAPTTEETLKTDQDILKLSMESKKLQEGVDKLHEILKDKQVLFNRLNNLEQSNEGMEKLVIENEILKKKLCETQTEANMLQIKQDINEETHKYNEIVNNLKQKTAKVQSLQNSLLVNDAKLYKLQKKLKLLDECDAKLEELQKENNTLRLQLKQEEDSKTDLNRNLMQETEKINQLKHELEIIQSKQSSSKNQAIQCVLPEDPTESSQELKELKQHVEELQQQQRYFLQEEASKKEERLMYLHKIMDLQCSKMQNLQQHQHEWEEMLTSINNVLALEEKTRKELDLKRMELEELNQVFADQNEELRKLEEYIAVLELKRQQEKEHLKQTFQKEINVMNQHLLDYQEQIKKQKNINLELEKRNERFQEDVNEDYAMEIAGYKKEIRELKSQLSRITEEKDDLLEHLEEIERETKDLKGNKREAIFIPDLNLLPKPADFTIVNANESVEVTKHQGINEDHLRILTKVLEAEYQRKMQRYDEHIHSLLTNVKSLKKSLKANEEKTALLSEENLQTKAELKDLQHTRKCFEDIRLKYEQSRNTIKELKETLAFERKKFELTDIGKSTQINVNNTYELPNLIDDYKKLIQQSAIASKRPSTSAILDLIQRSNQCVPNLQHLETNINGLRSDLQNFLSSFNHKMPATSFITAGSLSVPPSLMDELKAASEGF